MYIYLFFSEREIGIYIYTHVRRRIRFKCVERVDDSNLDCRLRMSQPALLGRMVVFFFLLFLLFLFLSHAAEKSVANTESRKCY